MFVIYVTCILCSVYFFNTDYDPHFTITSELTTIIVNSPHRLDENVDFLNKPISEIREEIIELHRTKEKYNKLIFMEFSNIQGYIKREKSNVFILVIGNIARRYEVFRNKDELILLGCKNNIYYDGLYYFCVCPTNRCGITCEYEKPSLFVNWLIAILSLLYILSFVKRKKEENSIVGVRSEKAKLE